MAQSNLNMEIQFLPGVGPKRAELLRKELAVETVGDLLRLYPFRYIDKSTIVRICDARPDMAYLQVRAKVLRVDLYGAQGVAAESTVKFNTIRRMIEAPEEYTLFLVDPTVPPTHNMAERCGRKYKRKSHQVISFRSMQGSVYFCDGLTIIENLRSQNLNLFEEIASRF